MELPQLCNRCGACCRQGGECVCRPWAGLPEKFDGRCEILKDEPDGSTSCKLINRAVNEKDGLLTLWAAHYLNGNCEWPELRKEICATV